MRNLSIENGLVTVILCVISPCLSFVSHSQQLGVILFLVFSLVVAFATNRIVIRWQAPQGSGISNLISLYRNVRDTPEILFLEKYRALNFFLNKLKLPNSTGDPATEPIRSSPKPSSEALPSDLSLLLC